MTLRERIWAHIVANKRDWFSSHEVAKELSVPNGQVVRALNWQRDHIEISQLNGRIKVFRVERASAPGPGVLDVSLAYAAVNDAALRQFINDAVTKERERVLKEIEGCLEKQRREQHHHLGSDIERTIRRIREESDG